MKDIRQKIKETFYLGNDTDTVASQIIEEIIKPIAKEAYQEGFDYCSQINGGVDFTEFGDPKALSKEEFIKEKFTSNKQ